MTSDNLNLAEHEIDGLASLINTSEQRLLAAELASVCHTMISLAGNSLSILLEVARHVPDLQPARTTCTQALLLLDDTIAHWTSGGGGDVNVVAPAFLVSQALDLRQQ